MEITRLALRFPAIVIAFMGVLFLAGISSYLTIPRDEDPRIHVRTCLISTSWPGASALDIERLVTDPLEEAVQTLDQVRTIRSDSKTGLSLIWVDLADKGLQASEVDNVWDQVQKRLFEATMQLPQGAQKPYLNRDFGKTTALLIAIYEAPNTSSTTKTEPNYTPRELEYFAEKLKDDFRRLKAVARVDLYGAQKEAIYVESELGHWSQLGITAEQLRLRLAERNILEAGGSIDGQWGRFNIRPSGKLESVKQIKNLMVAEKDVPIYLRDLGVTVSRRYQEPTHRLARFTNGQGAAPCLVLAITMKEGFNVVTLGNKTRERLRLAQQNVFPPDIRTTIISDAPTHVEKEVATFQFNLIAAVLLVVAVAFLLIGLRVALVMAAAIPLVIIGSIGLMTYFGVTLNNISIAALIVALGLLVDNAVEVCDNAHNFMAKGYSRFEAVARGSSQIAFPVLISTLTTVFAFIPMLFIPGNSGEYIRDLPIVVTLALLISYVTAFTFTALMAWLILRPGHHISPVQWIWQRIRLNKKKANSKTPPYFDRLCAFALRHKGCVLCASLAWLIVAMSLPATGRVGEEFFAFAHRDQFVVDVNLPASSTIAETTKAVKRVEALIQAIGNEGDADGGQPPLRNLVSFIGEGGPRFFVSVQPAPPSPQTAVILVNTTTPETVDAFIANIKKALEGGLEGKAGSPRLLPPVGARVTPRKFVKGPPLKFPVVYRILGPEPEQLRTYAAQAEKILAELPGTWAIDNSWGHAGYELAVEVKDEQAGLSGMTNHKIAGELNAYFNGQHLTTFREGDRTIPVYLRLPSEQATNLKSLDNVYIKGNSGKVPLDAISRIVSRFQPGQISRRNLERCIEVRCRLDPRVLASAIDRKAGPLLRKLQAGWDPAYRIEIGGEPELSAENQGYMQSSFKLSGLLIFLCLMALFHSFWKTAVVLTMIPLAAGGGFVGLYLTDIPMGFMAMLGLLSLAGIVINDALVLIEFIEHEIKESIQAGRHFTTRDVPSAAGLIRDEFRACVIRGTRMRVLPILLTTLTTVGGLLPLAFSGGPLWKPLAITVIFGLTISTILVFFVLPALYVTTVEWFHLQPVAIIANETLPHTEATATAKNTLTVSSATSNPIKKPIEAKPKQPNESAPPTPLLSHLNQKLKIKDKKPTLLQPLRPRYPEDMEPPTDPVDVSLLIAVDKQGRPVLVKARTKADQAYAKSSIRAVKAARFHPATEDGHPIEGKLKIRLRFKGRSLRKKVKP